MSSVNYASGVSDGFLKETVTEELIHTNSKMK